MPTIDCSLDFEIDVYLSRKNTATRYVEAATGLEDVSGWISATEDGETIHASLSATLTEATAALGHYVGTLNVDDLQDNLLPTYDGTTVYIVVEKLGSIQRKSFPYTVSS